jgi:hypothetical protein
MDIYERDITARQAAERFADAYGDGRKIGCWLINPHRFQLKGGARWYTVEMLPGWEGWRVDIEGAATR